MIMILPSLAAHNSRYLLFANAVFSTKLAQVYPALCVAFSNGINVSLGQLSHSILLAWADYKTTFFNFIRHVVLSRSEEEMINVDARRVITSVQHHHVIRYFTVIDDPRIPMGINLFASIPRKSSIPISYFTASPNLTSILPWIYLTQKLLILSMW